MEPFRISVAQFLLEGAKWVGIGIGVLPASRQPTCVFKQRLALRNRLLYGASCENLRTLFKMADDDFSDITADMSHWSAEQIVSFLAMDYSDRLVALTAGKHELYATVF
uniref:Uncharacterized protein n=1 Tax=Trichuris muris TaxID=70415 RepID=A0A5S6QDH0_TRIMR